MVLFLCQIVRQHRHMTPFASDSRLGFIFKEPQLLKDTQMPQEMIREPRTIPSSLKKCVEISEIYFIYRKPGSLVCILAMFSHCAISIS